MRSPLLRDIPEEFETERLIIRVPRPGDGPALNAAINDSFSELQPWMPWAKERPSLDRSEENSRRAYSQFLAREDITLRIIHKQTGLIIGSSGLHPRDWSVPRFEIGYWCRTRFTRQGYTTEAVRGILKQGFTVLGAQRIECQCDVLNLPSLAVARRVGFVQEGVLRNQHLGADGSLRDLVLFALTDADWRAGSTGDAGSSVS